MLGTQGPLVQSFNPFMTFLFILVMVAEGVWCHNLIHHIKKLSPNQGCQIS